MQQVLQNGRGPRDFPDFYLTNRGSCGMMPPEINKRIALIETVGFHGTSKRAGGSESPAQVSDF